MFDNRYKQIFSDEELINEIWKDIPEWEGLYQVSNLGRVKSLERYRRTNINSQCLVKEKILTPCDSHVDKRLRISLYNNCFKKQYQIHRLVLLTFYGACPKNYEACHNDGSIYNNRIENLRWDTHQNNEKDKIKHGTRLVGDKHPSCKLKQKDIVKIKELYKTGKYTQLDLAKKYNVVFQTISRVILASNSI